MAWALAAFVLGVLLVSVIAGLVYAGKRRKNDDSDLRARLRSLSPSDTACLFHPDAGPTEQLLLAGNFHRALAEAERLVARSAGDGPAHLVLARALLYCDQPLACADAVRRARSLGAGSRFCDYLDARLSVIAHEQELRGSSEPSLMSKTEVLLVRVRESGGDVLTADTSPRELAALADRHFEIYEQALAAFVALAEPPERWVEPAYQAARLAIKLGMPEGILLFEKAGAHIELSPDRFVYRRERAELRGTPAQPVTLDLYHA